MINGPSWGLVEQAVGKGQESWSFISYHLENRMLMDGIARITTIDLSFPTTSELSDSSNARIVWATISQPPDKCMYWVGPLTV